MIITFDNDQERGPGYGAFLLSDLGGVPEPQSLQFSLRRASDQQCLSMGGWQPAEVFLVPELVDVQGYSVRMVVGPQVIDQLDSQETYRFTLRGSDMEPKRATLTVQGVIYSPTSGGQGLASLGVGALVQPRQAPPPPIEEALLPPPPMDILPPPPEAPSIPDLVAGGKISDQPSDVPSNKAVMIALLALVLLGGGAFGAWYFTKEKSPPAVPEAPVITMKQQAHEHLKGTADPVKSMELAKDFAEKADGADSAFLLAEDAAEKGNSEGMLMTGEFYDPTSTKPGGSIQKSPRMAYDWYKKAKQAGHAEADAKLASLRAWAEKESATNDDAKELLKLMQ